MEAVLILWRLAVIVSVFAFPQLLGLLLYLRLRRAPRWFAVIASSLAPAVVFFFLAPIFFFAGLREAQAAGELTCGMPVVAALMFFFTGFIAQFFGSLIMQALLFKRRRSAGI
jgi:hypothetical protein